MLTPRAILNRIISAGVTGGLPESASQRLRLSNIMGLLMGLGLLPFCFLLTTPAFKGLASLIFAVNLCIPLFNRAGWFGLSRIINCLIIPVMLGVFALVLKEPEAEQLGYYKLLIASCLTLPLALYTRNEQPRRYTLISIIVLLFYAVQVYDVVGVMPKGPPPLPMVVVNEPLFRFLLRFVAPAMGFTIVIVSYELFQRADYRTMQRMLSLEVSRNEQLQTQEEKLRKNIEELTLTQEEMQRVQRRLAVQEANMKALINNSDASILSLDGDYRIIIANEALKKRYSAQGIQLEEGLAMLSLLQEDVRHTWQAYYDRALAGERFHFTLPSKDEEQVTYVEYYFNPIVDSHERPIGVSLFSRDVTERVQMEQALKNSEQRLRELNEDLEAQVVERTRQVEQHLATVRLILETAFDAIIVADGNHQIVDYNQRYLSLLAVPQAIALRRDTEEVMNYAFEQLVDPAWGRLRLKTILFGEIETTEDLFELKDGRWLRATSRVPAGGGVPTMRRIWYFRDVTQERAIELALLQQESRLKLFFELSNEGILLHEKFVIQDVNPALVRIIGYGREELLGRSVLEFVPEEDQRLLINSLALGETNTAEVKARRKDGSDAHLQFTARPLLATNDKPLQLRAVMVRELVLNKALQA